MAAESAADRADREVDLADQQHADDAERDDADRARLEGRFTRFSLDRKTGLSALEDDADDDEADDHRQRAEVAGADAVDEAWTAPRRPSVPEPLVLAVAAARRRAGVSSWLMPPPSFGVVEAAGAAARRAGTTTLSVAPVIAATISSEEISSTSNTPLLRPSRSTHDAVGHRLHVGHVVADHDHAVAALAQALDQVEHLGGLGHAEGGGRLVEDDQLRVAEQRPGDRHGLPLAARERRDGDRGPSGSSPTARAAAPTSASPSRPRRAAAG